MTASSPSTAMSRCFQARSSTRSPWPQSTFAATCSCLKGALFGLGCTVIGVGCPGDSDSTVGGNIIAISPLTVYIDGVVVGHNVLSLGGGPGVTFSPFYNYAFKDNTVHGDVVLAAWQGGWIGAIRNQIDGSLIYNANQSPNPEPNEIVANTMGRNLICFANSPAAQFGDAIEGAPPGYGPNVVGGQAFGQCADLLSLPV